MEVETIITASTIQQLKQVNISVDGEKTKERVSALWKGAATKDREAILTLAGLAKPSVQRVYRTGSISAKLVIPIAQTLNVSPFYLTGESDDKGKCTDKQLKQLLEAHGYAELIDEQSPEVKSKPIPVTEEEKESAIQGEPLLECQADQIEQVEPADEYSFLKDLACFLENAKTPENETFIESMTEEDMILLVRAIMLRAKAGGVNAVHAKLLKMLLLS